MRGEARMLVHPEELRWAQLNERHLQFEPLTRDQIHSIMERGRKLHRWYKSHHLTHSLINLLVLIFCSAATTWCCSRFLGYGWPQEAITRPDQSWLPGLSAACSIAG